MAPSSNPRCVPDPPVPRRLKSQLCDASNPPWLGPAPSSLEAAEMEIYKEYLTCPTRFRVLRSLLRSRYSPEAYCMPLIKHYLAMYPRPLLSIPYQNPTLPQNYVPSPMLHLAAPRSRSGFYNTPRNWDKHESRTPHQGLCNHRVPAKHASFACGRSRLLTLKRRTGFLPAPG
jgi:hypothetical protein